MLALLAFLLAITFSMVSSRYAARKQLVLDEANALGTALLRTDFLEDPQRTESRQLLMRYVNIRAEVAETDEPDIISQIVEESELLHDQLWSLAMSASSQAADPVLFSLYVESLNEVIDLHSARYYQGVQYRLSKGTWLALYFVTVIVMIGVGFEFGISGSGSFLGALLLALVFSAVISFLSELDEASANSLFRVNQQPMVDLQQKLNSSNE
jgi:hypothetical protein